MKQWLKWHRGMLFWAILYTSLLAQEGYRDNHSCSECHSEIYEEYQSSFHAKGYFNDALHRDIANRVSQTKYTCAYCHMPMADNLKSLVTGQARPNPQNPTHTDAISCYFCHTIAYVKKAHHWNENILSKQAKGYKPTLYGTLQEPEKNTKHSSVHNPLYTKQVCIGCHGHKRNENNVTLFWSGSKQEGSLGCIKCHMPLVSGGAEKMNKALRTHHRSHHFLGIHDKTFRKKGVKMELTLEGRVLAVTLENKMGHPLIIQPARAKFVGVRLLREKKVIWTNHADDPIQNAQGYFSIDFEKAHQAVILPNHATSKEEHNLQAKEKRVLHYTLPPLKRGDEIEVGLYLFLAKPQCATLLEPQTRHLMEPESIKISHLKVK